MEAVAKLRNVPTSTRKMRLIADLIRGKGVDLALNTLKFDSKIGSKRMEKLLLSAIANWQEKNKDSKAIGYPRLNCVFNKFWRLIGCHTRTVFKGGAAHPLTALNDCQFLAIRIVYPAQMYPCCIDPDDLQITRVIGL